MFCKEPYQVGECTYTKRVHNCVCQVCGQQGLAQRLDQGGALGPADMVALAAAYPLLFIQVTHQSSSQSVCCT